MLKIYHEGELINKAGVDRVVLSHVVLLKINWPVFKSALKTSNDIVYDAFKARNRTCYVTEGGDVFHHMTITNPEIGHLVFGANPKRYGLMELSPSNIRDGINLVNFTGAEFIRCLANTAKMLCERFGLVISFSNSTFREIEVNCTFALKHPFTEYYRPLSVLFSDMPYLKKKCEYTGKEKNEKKLQSCSAFNKQLSVTAYNKSLEMAVAIKQKGTGCVYDENGEVIESDLMRVEYKLKTAEVCKKWFVGLNTVADFKEEMVDEAFERLIKYYLLFPLARWEVENERGLNRIVKSYIKRSKKGYGWKTKLLTELRNEELKNREVTLLDLNDLNMVIFNYSDKSGHKTRLQISKNSSGFAFDDVFLQNDREKLNEIVGNLKCYIHDDINSSTEEVNVSIKMWLEALLAKGL